MKTAPREGWRDTVRSWGREPLKGGATCRCMGWSAGSACGKCWRCASAADRPPDGANVEAWLAAKWAGEPTPVVVKGRRMEGYIYGAPDADAMMLMPDVCDEHGEVHGRMEVSVPADMKTVETFTQEKRTP